jgi:arylsulfatase A-like enzyme
MSYNALDSEAQRREEEQERGAQRLRQQQSFWVLGVLALTFLGLFATMQGFYGNAQTGVTSFSSEEAGASNPKHVVLFLADDMAYVDMDSLPHKFSNLTPNINDMLTESVRMNRHYSMHVCTPARASLLTGKYPLHIGMQHDLIQLNSPWGLPTTQRTMAEMLQDEGFKTHMVGKWHLGHHAEGFLPHNRGFHTSLGYLTGMEHYYTRTHTLLYDDQYWYDHIYAESEDWSGVEGGAFKTEDVSDGTYGPKLHLQRAKQIIEEHDKSTSLFLYYSAQNVHAPLDDPPNDIIDDHMADFINDYSNNSFERSYLRSLVWLDHQVGRVQHYLDEQGILEDTMFVFIFDNGGCHLGGGFSQPLRGGKGMLFEGGVKTNAFVWTSDLSKEARGNTYTNLMHISDWLPTIMSYVTSDDQYDISSLHIDGVNHWASIRDASSVIPRGELLLNIDTFLDGNSSARPRGIIVGDYKMIYEYQAPVFDPADTARFDTQNIKFDPLDCIVDRSGSFKRFVFDLINDPYETTNLVNTLDSDVIEYMEKRLRYYAKDASTSCFAKQDYSVDVVKRWEDFDDYIVPWRSKSYQVCEDSMDGGDGSDDDDQGTSTTSSN